MNIIVLNADYTFLNVVSVPHAFRLMFQDKVEVVAWSERTVRTVSRSFKVPAVMKLVRFVRDFFKRGMPWKSANVFIRDGDACQYCGRRPLRGKNRTIDHVLPRSRGGKNSFENTVACCAACNRRKGDSTPEEAGMSFFRKGWTPYKPTFVEFLRKQADELGVYDRLVEAGVF